MAYSDSIKTIIKAGLIAAPRRSWCPTFDEIDAAIAEQKKQRHEAARRKWEARQRRLQQQREHSMPKGKAKFSFEFADDAQVREYGELTGLQLDAPDSPATARSRPWESSPDAVLQHRRLEGWKSSEETLKRLRHQKLVDRDEESKRLRANAGDYAKAPLHDVLNKDGTVRERGVLSRINELGIDISDAPSPLQPVRRELDAGSRRPDPTWQDSRERARAARQPPEQPSPEQEIASATRNGRLDVRRLSAAAFSAVKSKYGIG